MSDPFSSTSFDSAAKTEDGRDKHGKHVTESLLKWDNSLPRSSTVSKQTPDRSHFRRIGWVGLVALSAGTLCMLAALAFLMFLWIGTSSNATWHRIVLAGWTARSITVSALLIRIAVAAQASLCTAMIAGLLLQRPGVMLPHLPAVALARIGTAGPAWLAWQQWSSLMSRKNLVYTCVTALLILTSTASQFTSTILLSGIDLSMVPSRDSRAKSWYAVKGTAGWEPDSSQVLYWTTKPTAYPAMAEYNEPVSNTGGTFDTGTAMRALLPIPLLTDREMTKSYSGKATVMNGRVVCTRPQIKDVSFYAGYCGAPPTVTGLIGTDGQARGLGTWCDEICRNGSVLDDPSLTSLISDNDPSDGDLLPFECSTETSSTAVGVSQPNTPATICNVGSWMKLKSQLVLQDGFGDTDTIPEGIAFLVTKTNGSAGEWRSAQKTEGDGPCNSAKGGRWQGYFGMNASSHTGDEWLTYTSQNTSSDTSLSFSLCFTNFATMDMPIDVSRPANATEPVMQWNATETTYNTSAVRRQLGAVSEDLTIAQRGNFEIASPLTSSSATNWSNPSGQTWYEPNSPDGYVNKTLLAYMLYWLTSTQSLSQPNNSLLLCKSCVFDPAGLPTGSNGSSSNNNQTSPHEIYGAIFTDTLRETGKPALALQALFTTLLRAAYYDVVEQFNVGADATTVSFIQVSVPTSIGPLLAVVGVLGVHLVVLALVTAAFVREGTLSLLGNVWAALGQMRDHGDGDEGGRLVGEWMATAAAVGGRTDAEIGRLMDEEGSGRVVLGLDVGEGKEEVQLRKRD